MPGKGAVLTRVARFWFDRLADVIPNHLSSVTLDDLPLSEEERQMLSQRCMLVRRLKPLPVEAIVRGYLIGSGWKDYQQSGSLCGIELPPGLQLAERLPAAIFTPSTKAEVGGHDINISFEQMKQQLGTALAEQVRDVSLTLYQQAAEYALQR
ncbi:unnamed protein product, partial [Cyprideis torosa]